MLIKIIPLWIGLVLTGCSFSYYGDPDITIIRLSIAQDVKARDFKAITKYGKVALDRLDSDGTEGAERITEGAVKGFIKGVKPGL